MSEIKTLKLSTGEEVICKIEEIDEECGVYTISSPLTLGLMRGQNGVGLGFAPWIFSTKSGQIELNVDQIVGLATPDNEVEKAYLSEISGIQLAPAGSLIQG